MSPERKRFQCSGTNSERLSRALRKTLAQQLLYAAFILVGRTSLDFDEYSIGTDMGQVADAVPVFRPSHQCPIVFEFDLVFLV
jgi:hypothetical protein